MKNNIFLLGITIATLLSCSESTIDEEVLGTLVGTVIEGATGLPLENVQISTNPASSTVFSDENGNFVFDNILVDDYSVQAELDGFSAAFESVAITANTISNVAFELEPSSTTNDAPSQPVLIFPEDEQVGLDTQVEFAWDATDPENDDLDYTLQLRDGGTNEIQNFEISQDTTFVVNNLRLSTNYFWQVSATDGTNDPVTSTISSFTTLDSPSNPILFTRRIGGNNVIFSGSQDTGNNQTDINVLQITSETSNSFRPRRNSIVNRIAFLRTVGGETHLFTMSLAGEDVQQVTSSVPVVGFRQEEVRYAWAENGSKLYYANFDKLYSINTDGSGLEFLYQTSDGSFISEIDLPEITSNIVALKTNDINGYNVRIFTIDISSGVEQSVALESVPGAAGGIDISANGDTILYTYDVSGAENSNYRIFESRIFTYDIIADTTQAIDISTQLGENDLDTRFSPSEGNVIFTRVLNNPGAIPTIATFNIGNQQDLFILFTDGAKMADWESN